MPPPAHEHFNLFIHTNLHAHTRTRLRREYARPGLPTARISPPEHVSDVQGSTIATALTVRALRVAKATSDLHPRYSQIATHGMIMHENR